MTNLTLFSQGTTGSSVAFDTGPYTMGVQFSVSKAGCTLPAIWFYSPSGATVLPSTIALYAVSGTSLVHSESASWSGAAGAGWVRAAFATPPALTGSTSYKACVLQTAAADWYSGTSHYWDSGAGSAGIANGVLSAPNNAGADGGQDSFTNSASLAYPSSSFNATNYWVDPEITVPAASAGLGWLTTAMMRRRRPARGLWRGPAFQAPTALSFTIGLLTAFSAPGAAVLGLLDETGGPVQDEAQNFILSEDGS